MPPTDRYHGLDALRAFAMFLGVYLHGAVAYAVNVPPFWPVREPSEWPLIDVTLVAVHNFRLPAFFLLSGFFAALLRERRGVRGLVRNRLLRVGVPLAGVMLVALPLLLMVAAVFTEHAAAGAVRELFTSGAFEKYWKPLHLWFLWYLLLLLAVGLPLGLALERLPVGRLGRGLVSTGALWVLLGAGASAFLFVMPEPYGPDTPFHWTPDRHILGFYGLYAAAGVLLYRNRDLLPSLARQAWRFLAAAHLVALPVGFLAGAAWDEGGRKPWADQSELRAVAATAFGSYGALTTAGLIGLALRYLSEPRPWVRYLADSAYWCYLASLVPILLFQCLLMGVPVAPELKAFAVTVGSTAVLLASYQWLVRGRWIGRVLNGPRTAGK